MRALKLALMCALLFVSGCKGKRGGPDGGAEDGGPTGAITGEVFAFSEASGEVKVARLGRATVSLFGSDGGEVKTDEGGAFRLEGVPRDAVLYVQGVSEGYLPALSRPVHTDGGEATTSLYFATVGLVQRLSNTRYFSQPLDTTTGMLLARVVDGAERPLGGARVGVVNGGSLGVIFGADPKPFGVPPGGAVLLDGLSQDRTFRVAAKGYETPDLPLHFEPGYVTGVQIHAAVSSQPAPSFADAGVRYSERTLPFPHSPGANVPLMESEFLPGVVARDFNGDGVADMFFTGGPNQPHRLLFNDGAGNFTDMSGMSGIAGPDGGNGACAADLDGDRFPELYVVGNYGLGTLYRNRGQGLFEEVPDAGVPGPARFGQSCAFADVDGDQLLELTVAGYEVDGGLPVGELRVYHNQGGLSFSDITLPVGGGPTLAMLGPTYIVSYWDPDEDGFADLMTGQDFGRMRSFKNTHPGGINGLFKEVSEAQGLGNKGPYGDWMAVTFGDYDGDLDEDVFMTSISDAVIPFTGVRPYSSLNYLGAWDPMSQRFTSRAFEANVGDTGWAWGAEFADVNNDGHLDLYVVGNMFTEGYGAIAGYPIKSTRMGTLIPGGIDGRRTTLLVNQGDGTFQDGTPSAGIHLETDTRAVATADLNGDHTLDFAVTSNGGPPTLYLSQGRPNNAFAVRALGKGPNGDAIGATVWVTAGGRTQMRHVRAGSGYLSTSEPVVRFGIGSAQSVEKVVVKFPSGAVVEAGPLAAGGIYLATEP